MWNVLLLSALVFLAAPLFVSCNSNGKTQAEFNSEIEAPVDAESEAEDFEDAAPVVDLPDAALDLPVSVFGEVWGYVVAGRENALNSALPVSDVGYFAADIDSYGTLVDIPRRRALPAFGGRVHLVAKCDGRALTHFVLAPNSAERKALVSGLLAAAADYDGLQIDYEYVPARDAGAFLSFLGELRAGLGDKMFTIAVPARNRKISNDVYDYEKIKPLVDRILVMAYDEHWSTSRPGPVASLPWCKRVADYALGVIGREKLIMGLPFYGRAWGDENPSRALVYSTVENVMTENGVTEIRRENGIPVFDYEIPVAVTVYYDDDYSLSARMEMYRAMNIGSIGFWRIGQETPAVWKLIQLEDHNVLHR